jgi:hypothetical protein
MRPIKNLLRRLAEFCLRDLADMQARALLLAGQRQAGHVRSLPDAVSLREAEFRVFSQWGEDGILQYLLGRVPITQDFFVEFGVEDYREANTRFLLLNDNWAGLVLDGSPENVERIREERWFWRHDIAAEHVFVTRENIDGVLARHAPDPDIGLLSIDIDGNDYWVWEAITTVRPRIVVCEYNSVFGPDAAVSVPYAAAFDRTQAHSSNLYWGASLAALCHLAERKGYVLAGSNTAGNNAFFVRVDCAARIRAMSAREAYVPSRFRESRDRDGRLSLLSGRERAASINELSLTEVTTGRTLTVKAAVGANR